jgi:RNase P subunit RPR2
MKKVSKLEVQEKVKKFFSDITNKTPKDVKKIKRLAMRYNISLRNSRKKFCKKCFNPFVKPKTRIKKDIKTIACETCGYVSRWKIK